VNYGATGWMEREERRTWIGSGDEEIPVQSLIQVRIDVLTLELVYFFVSAYNN